MLPFLGAIGLATVSFPMRTIRWRYLLRLEGNPLPFVPLWHATAIGFMANNVLPARVGEFARAYAAQSLTSVRFTTAFGSIAVERVLDGITLVGVLALAMWAGDFAADTTVGAVRLGDLLRGAGVIFALGLIVALAVVFRPRPALQFTRWSARRFLPDRWATRLVRVVEGLLSGLEGLRSPGRLVAVAFWSVMVWLTNIAGFWLGFVAFGIEAPWSAAFLVMAIVAFGVAIPSTPGFFGPFEAAIRASLGLYAIGAERAVSFAVGFHLGGFLPITLLGFWSLGRAHLHLADLRRGQERLPANGSTPESAEHG